MHEYHVRIIIIIIIIIIIYRFLERHKSLGYRGAGIFKHEHV